MQNGERMLSVSDLTSFANMLQYHQMAWNDKLYVCALLNTARYVFSRSKGFEPLQT